MNNLIETASKGHRPSLTPTDMNLFRRLLVTAALVAVALPAAAQENSLATTFVQSRADQIISIVNAAARDQSQLDAQREALRVAIRDFLSFETLAQRTLRGHWDTRTPEQQAEFVALLRDLIETSYSRSLGSDDVDQNGYDVSYTGERSRRDRTTVEATVTVNGEQHLVEVKLQGEGGEFIVYDLVTDDVSLEESYAESFDSIIAEDGWDGLLNRMRERLAELRAEL